MWVKTNLHNMSSWFEPITEKAVSTLPINANTSLLFPLKWRNQLWSLFHTYVPWTCCEIYWFLQPEFQHLWVLGTRIMSKDSPFVCSLCKVVGLQFQCYC
jgi:hypothetical protein